MTLAPKAILAFAIMVPGAGHIALGRASRGAGILFFTLFFSALTWHFCPPDRSIIGRTAGGLFIWALSIPDAYRSALLRQKRGERPVRSHVELA